MNKVLLLVIAVSFNAFASVVFWEVSEQPYQCSNGKSYDVLTETWSMGGGSGSWGLDAFCKKGILTEKEYGRSDGDSEDIQACRDDETEETQFCFEELKTLNTELRGGLDEPLQMIHGEPLVAVCKVDITKEYRDALGLKNGTSFSLKYYIHQTSKAYKIDTKLIVREFRTEHYELNRMRSKMKIEPDSILIKGKNSLKISVDKKSKTSNYEYAYDRDSYVGNIFVAEFVGKTEIGSINEEFQQVSLNLDNLSGSCLVK